VPVNRCCASACLGLLVACGSRSDLTRFTPGDGDDASGHAGRPGLGRGGVGGASLSGGAGDSPGGAGSSAGGGGPVSTGAAGGVEPDETPIVDLNAPPLCAARPLSLDEALRAALDDISRLPASERAFMRYVSVGYRRTVDCAGGEQAQRPSARDVALLVNLTSASAAIGLPAPIGPTRDSLLRIDLRHYGWERELVLTGVSHPNAWEAIASLSALALEFTGPEGDALSAESGTRYPLLSFSDLLAQNTQGELYYELVGLPDTLAELAARLEVPLDEPAGEGWMRAGTAQSRIVREPRGVARRRAASPDAPMFWLGLDFSATTALPGVFLEPLALQADSSVALFSLPNGLFGFFTADAEGRRLTESPLLIDTNQGDFVARNAVSCMTCHANGPLELIDEVREFASASVGAAFDESELRAIEAAYPSPSELTRQFEDDTARVERSLAKVGAAAADLTTLMAELTRNHQSLSLARVAGELFVGEAELRASLPSLPPALAVAAFSGSLDRATFESAYAPAMCVLHQSSVNRPTPCP
jgi:hypothetical protein